MHYLSFIFFILRYGSRIEERSTEKWNEMASCLMKLQVLAIQPVLITIHFYIFKPIILHLPPSGIYTLSTHST